ncbi:CPCC family cysteine-rich protein [Desertivirga arenae]|uniref:CPCC family cysteine-rich protein n=1 Tax=Desertivirga arenae TaxID=2810309 RepID=UPI00351081E4
MERYTCPCCGYKTLILPPGRYDICSICFWEDCPIQKQYVDDDGGPNKVPLHRAQKNF